MSTKFTLKTEVGDVVVHVYADTRVSVTAGHIVNEKLEGPDLTVNRVALQCDGSWEFRNDSIMTGWRPSYFRVARRGGGWNGYKQVKAPRGASQKVFDAVRAALTAWSKGDAAAIMLADAKVQALIAEALSLEEDARKLQATANEKDEKAAAKRKEAAEVPDSIRLISPPAFMSEQVEG